MSLQLGAIDPIAFSLGGLSVHWYGVIIASAVLLAIFLVLFHLVSNNF